MITLPFTTLVNIILVETGIFLFLFFSFLFRKMLLVALLRKAEAIHAKNVTSIDKYIDGNTNIDIQKISTSIMTRNYLFELMNKVTVENNIKLKELYTKLGFERRDIKSLIFASYDKKIHSLLRLIRVRSKIPKRVVLRLLKSKNVNIRFKTMEYIILSEESKSLTTLVDFINKKENMAYRGYILFILKKYACVDFEGILFLVNHTTDIKLIYLLFLVIVDNPHPNVEDKIYQVITLNSPTPLIRCAIRILAKLSSDRSMGFYEILADHKHPSIRCEIAKALHSVDSKRADKILFTLSNDNIYSVREYAFKAILNHDSHETNKFISDAFKDKSNINSHIIDFQYILKQFWSKNE